MDYIDSSYINPMPQLTISKETFKVTVGNIERVFKSATQERESLRLANGIKMLKILLRQLLTS